MRKIFAKIHLWLSIPFGVIIAITCFTGAILVFENELLRLFHPSWYHVEEVGEQPLSEEALLEAARLQLDDDIQIKGIRRSDDPQETWQIKIPGRRAAAFIDPYTAEITGINDGQGFFMKMGQLHKFLMDTHKNKEGVSLGKLAVDISALAFVLVLISGFIDWIPRTKSMLRNRLTIKTRKGWYRFFYDLHVSGGFYMTLLLLAMTVTGLTWSFDWFSDAFYYIFSNETNTSEVRSMVYSIHVGSWGGLLTRILTCLACFLGGIFVITGYYFWIRKMVRKHSARK